MARGKTLEELLNMLRAEAGHSLNVSGGVSNTDVLKKRLARTQELLYEDYDWPFLKVFPYKPLSVGQRWYDVPADLNIDRIIDVAIWYSGSPRPALRGIGFDDYAQYDSDNDERASPVLKWDHKYNPASGDDQIEVWPIPSDSGMKLQFCGLRPLPALIEDADTAVLDDHLIVLTLAAEILARQKHEDAPLMAQKAAARYNKLRQNSKGGSDTITMGGAGQPSSLRGRTVIRIGS